MKPINKILNLVVLLGLSLGLIIGCQKKTTTSEVIVEQTTVNKEVTPQLSDAQIASIAITANQVDINYADLALKKTKNPQVEKFAQTMKNDHQSVIQAAVDLASELSLTPQENPTTLSLLEKAKKELQVLESSDNFDKAYIENEIDYHTFVISTLENTLIPNTQNTQLKELLIQVVPNFQHHLEMAKQIQGQIK
ncbi:DUF4142 domain-containing protein [Myroides sp. LJL116]